MFNNILKIPRLIFPRSDSAANLAPNKAAPLPEAQPGGFFPPFNFKEIRFNMNQPAALYNMASNLRAIIAAARTADHEVIILCIGTDRSTGDALGPLAGSKLKLINLYPDVYGTLEEPVHAANLTEKIKFIKNNYTSPFVIAVDACLGKVENIGCFTLGSGAVKPGAAVNKDLPEVGDAYITGIVNVGGFMEHMVLQSTRLNLVVKMADVIAHGLSYGLGRADAKQ